MSPSTSAATKKAAASTTVQLWALFKFPHPRCLRKGRRIVLLQHQYCGKENGSSKDNQFGHLVAAVLRRQQGPLHEGVRQFGLEKPVLSQECLAKQTPAPGTVAATL
jgi:hypothetical protein